MARLEGNALNNRPDRPVEFDDMLATLVANLRRLRARRGLTHTELGVAAGVSRNHYQLLEAGRASSGGPANPRLSTIIGLSRALEVSISELLCPQGLYSTRLWVDLYEPLTDEKRQQVWDVLLQQSLVAADGSEAAAFVGTEEKVVTVALTLRAEDETAAARQGRTFATLALYQAGFSAATASIHDHVEVRPGTSDFFVDE